jgi:FAD dependent oxidoreductase
MIDSLSSLFAPRRRRQPGRFQGVAIAAPLRGRGLRCEFAAVEYPVAVAAFPIDSHNCQRIVQDGKLTNEGDIEVDDKPHSVGYGALIPRLDDCDNLLVPVCLSATHVAYGSLRTEPVLMQLGEAAGLAAALAVTCGKSVQEIDRTMLEHELKSAKAVIRPEHGRGSAPWPHERLR